MEVVLVTVPTTGTKFTLGLFREAGFDKARLDEKWMPETEGDVIYHSHCEYGRGVKLAYEYAQRMPLICTCRHPYRVEESWRRQGRPVDSLIMAYESLINDFAPLAQYWVCVDSEAREAQLEALSEGLGIEIVTDWTVVNTKGGTYDADLDDLSPSEEVRELVENNEEFFNQWYAT